MHDFSALNLPGPLAKGIEALGYAKMTPIQAESLPAILAGRDVLGQARTGTGKTTAFGLGLLAALEPGTIQTQGLVLCPTRELADQVAKGIRALARFIPNVKVTTLTGGVSLRPHVASLEQHDPHVVVGTPGRVQELLRKKHLHLAGVKVLVLDEADRMLDIGFEEAIREIVGKAPQKRQTLLFSATFPPEIRGIAKSVLRDPLEVVAADVAADAPIEQRFHEVELPRKVDALIGILAEHRIEQALVFCNTRRDTDEVAAALAERGVAALALHGEIDQRERDEMLVRFANRSASVLVATDVAARGLDIHDLPAVVSYELATDPDAHLHRIGRTARAGAKGLALNLVTPREMPRATTLEAMQGSPLRWEALKAGGKPGDLHATMVTLRLDAGRTDKMRPGDILGALTGDAGLPADAVGKIDVFPTRSYVAIRRAEAGKALERLRSGRIKGRNVRVLRL